MKARSRIAFVAIACTWIASTLLVAGPVRQSNSTPPPATQSDPVAVERFTRLCSRCHDGARITAMRRTSTEWEEVITKMIERGATGTEQELNSVFDYLLATFGKVYVNTAAADELMAVLGLSKKDAEAIVDYRKANGTFAEFDALKKVPGIDVKALELHKDAVVF